MCTAKMTKTPPPDNGFHIPYAIDVFTSGVHFNPEQNLICGTDLTQELIACECRSTLKPKLLEALDYHSGFYSAQMFRGGTYWKWRSSRSTIYMSLYEYYV